MSKIRSWGNYNLAGQTIRIRPRELMEPSMLLDDNTTDPWRWAEHKAEVVQETPYFLVLKILPQYNPHGYGVSREYNTTIHKHDIRSGVYILKDEDGNRIKARGAA
ncbi:MAG: hypothetical protein LUD12_02855 [Lachnospiraceae bacterium]|nr:hypothetical protein [Lachnospiraceae bacterium]